MKTREILEALGFEPVWGTMTDQEPAYRYDFGNLELSATQVCNMSLRPVFLFGGVALSSRSLSKIHFELPLEVESFEQGVAWISFGLGRDFTPMIPTEWVADGRRHIDALPWERIRREYDARPQCMAEREWFRVASRKLRDMATSAGENELATFRFDGAVLRIDAPGVVIALPARGEAWDEPYRLAARSLTFLPKRFLNDTVHISVWDGAIHIGNRVFHLANP